MLLAKIKKSFIISFYYTGFLKMFGFIYRTLIRKPCILVYHSVSEEGCSVIGASLCVSEKNFNDHISYLRKNFHCIAFSDYIDIISSGNKFPAHTVIITFDDGFKDTYQIAFPILIKNHIPFIIFLTVDCIESKQLLWLHKLNYLLKRIDNSRLKDLYDRLCEGINGKKKLSTEEMKKKIRYKLLFESDDKYVLEAISSMAPESNEDRSSEQDFARGIYLTWAEITKMIDARVEIGSHGLTHFDLTKMDEKKLREEVVISKRILEGKLNKPVHFFAFPLSRSDSREERLLKETGYLAGCSTGEAIFPDNVSPYRLERTVVRDISVYELAFELSGLGDVGRKLKKKFIMIR